MTDSKIASFETKRMNISDMNPAEYNPRRMTDKAREGLSNSMSTFGLVQPVIWNEKTGNIVGGHQRVYEMVRQGIEATDVIVVNLEPIQEKALNIALNHPGISGEFDEDKLNSVLAELEHEDVFKSLNFDDLYIPSYEDIPDVSEEEGKVDSKARIVIELEDPSMKDVVLQQVGTFVIETFGDAVTVK